MFGKAKFILFGLILFVAQAIFANPYELKDMADRVAPLAKVRVAGQTDTISSEKPAPVQKPLTGPDVYKKFCVACHGAGVAGAPKHKDKLDWAKREEKGAEALFKNAWHGINAMPPKGTCSTCTEKQIKDAIEYMLP